MNTGLEGRVDILGTVAGKEKESLKNEFYSCFDNLE